MEIIGDCEWFGHMSEGEIQNRFFWTPPLPMPLNHAPTLPLPMPLNLDSALHLPMTLPLPMKMDPVFMIFFRSARAAFIGKILGSIGQIY